jgi:heptaprenyl diphosphate synthase
VLGKPSGQDLAEGVYTLPVLLALRDPAVAPELEPLLGRPLATPEREKAKAMVASSAAVGATVAAAERFTDQAAEAAGALGEAELGRSMAALARGLLDDLPVPSCE